jgi:hypothetical protein
MRRRRAETRRQEGRRRLRRLLWGVAVVAAIGAGAALLHSPLVAVRHAVVRGNSHTPAGAVLAAAGLAPQDPSVPMVDVDSQSRARAVEALPWVGHVAFHRSWPWGVVIEITERRPVGVVAGAGGADIVDASGRVLQVLPPPGPSGVVAELRSKGLPALAVLSGPAGAPPGGYLAGARGTTAQALQSMEQAAAAVPEPVAQRGLTLRYSAAKGLLGSLAGGGATVLFGDDSDIGTKLAVLSELEQRTQLPRYSLVNLTVPARPTLQGPTLAAQNGVNG